jgi:hypothetical protein
MRTLEVQPKSLYLKQFVRPPIKPNFVQIVPMTAALQIREFYGLPFFPVSLYLFLGKAPCESRLWAKFHELPDSFRFLDQENAL